MKDVFLIQISMLVSGRYIKLTDVFHMRYLIFTLVH